MILIIRCASIVDLSPVFSGQYAVRFIPRETGVHLVHVLFDNYHIPESPFKICVGKVDADAGKVTASGEGLRSGKTGKENLIQGNIFKLLIKQF